MTGGQTYYDGLIAQGYPADQALGYTQQYYPGFTPAAAAQESMPLPAPIPSQPLIQPQATPQPQVMLQPMAQAIPVQQQIVYPALGGVASVAVAPIAQKKPILTWVAIGCITIAVLLALVGQFGNSWQVQNDESIENGAGQVSLGLSNMKVDCTGVAQEQSCIQLAYVLLADDMDNAASESPPSDSIVKGPVENYCENTYSLTISLAGDNQELRNQAGDDRENCLSNDAAGGVTGITVWIAMLGLLSSAVMLTVSSIGKELPASAQRYGRTSSFIGGGLAILGAVIWLLMKYDFDGNFDNGSSFYFILFAGILAIVAGILDTIDKR
ncbi:MAG: hypothetical protein CMB43_03165 [Euryarchaeota archaeon]|nr:hypothetical protein [Euryarchaeota archaeon]|tara:strand:- start:4550 stop:5527 length:978 start_codon:yes stop_codon:yes gene_type:complete